MVTHAVFQPGAKAGGPRSLHAVAPHMSTKRLAKSHIRAQPRALEVFHFVLRIPRKFGSNRFDHLMDYVVLAAAFNRHLRLSTCESVAGTHVAVVVCPKSNIRSGWQN